MKTTLYTLADMKGFNLKTEEAFAISKALGKPKIYSRDSVFPFGSLIPKFFTLIKKRNWFIKLMDTWLWIEDDDLAVFFPHCFYKTCNVSKLNGAITINFVTSGIGKDYIKLETEENKKYGLPPSDYNEHALKCALASDYAIVTSNWFKKILIKEGFPEKKIFMTHLGINTKRFKPGKKRDDDVFVVLCVADFTPMKGLEYLIKAWRKLKLKDAELWLLGNMPKELEKLWGVSDWNIRTFPHGNPIPYYQQADLFVLPSLSEGSSRTMYEAMSCGLPVIVTENVGAIIKDRDKTFEIVTKDTGRIVPIKDSDALVKQIKWFYNNPEKTKRMGEKAHKHIQQFIWKNYTKRIKEILEMIKK